MVRISRWLQTSSLGAALIAGGCDAAGPMPQFDQTPTIALLITPDPPPGFAGTAGSDSGLFALLVTTATPVQAPYLRADRFEMTRATDGARFGWRSVDTPTQAVDAFGYSALGNYFLPRSESSAGLGSDSILEGGVYELVIHAGEHQIVGRTRVPGRVEFVREATDGDTIVRWRRTPGAARYALAGGFTTLRPIEDTMIVVRPPPPFPGFPERGVPITVIALDSNYALFRSEDHVGGAGITGAWGVFGSYTWSEITMPPATASAPPR
jgi:hypothetical protein